MTNIHRSTVKTEEGKGEGGIRCVPVCNSSSCRRGEYAGGGGERRNNREGQEIRFGLDLHVVSSYN